MEPLEEVRHEIAVGMEVLAADGSLIGTVRRVWWPEEASDAVEEALPASLPGHPAAGKGAWQSPDEGYFQLDRGEKGIIDRYLYVPLSAVQQVDADHVVLRVPLKEVDTRGWHIRPHFLK